MRAVRESRGITQLELALKLGVAQPSVSIWERGIVPIPKAREEEIAKILDMEPDQLTIDWDSAKPRRQARATTA
jgi:transcriptional regulator with XRE-family HTH domain